MQVTSHRLFELLPDIDLPHGDSRIVQFDKPISKMTPKERAQAQRERAFYNANAALKRKFAKLMEERRSLVMERLKRYGPRDMRWISTNTKIPYKAVRMIVISGIEQGKIVKTSSNNFALSVNV